MKKLSLLFGITFLLSSVSVEALTKKEVLAWTEFASVASGAIGYVILARDKFFDAPFTFPNSSAWWQKVKIKNGYRTPLGAGLTTFAATNALLGWILSKYTPHARYEWALQQLTNFEKKYLFNQRITQDTIGHILQESGCEAHELSLVSAFLETQYFDNKLIYMADQLDRAINDEGYSQLSKNMSQLLVRVNTHLKRLRANEATIKNQEKWLDQWKIYQKQVLERERRQAVQTHIVWQI